MSTERRVGPIRAMKFGLLAIATTFVPSITMAADNALPLPDYNNRGVQIRPGATFPLQPGDVSGRRVRVGDRDTLVLYDDLSGHKSSTPLPDYDNPGVKVRPGATFPLQPGDVSGRRVRVGDRDTVVMYGDLSKNK